MRFIFQEAVPFDSINDIPSSTTGRWSYSPSPIPNFTWQMSLLLGLQLISKKVYSADPHSLAAASPLCICLLLREFMMLVISSQKLLIPSCHAVMYSGHGRMLIGRTGEGSVEQMPPSVNAILLLSRWFRDYLITCNHFIRVHFQYSQHTPSLHLSRSWRNRLESTSGQSFQHFPSLTMGEVKLFANSFVLSGGFLLHDPYPISQTPLISVTAAAVGWCLCKRVEMKKWKGYL